MQPAALAPGRSSRPFRFSTHDTKPSQSFTSLPPIRQRTSSSATQPKDSYHSSVAADPSRPMSSDATVLSSLPRRSRGSLLGAASDALSGRFGLRKKSTRQSRPEPALPKLVLDSVIQVVPTHLDEEERERQRLRDAAAQSVGIGLDLLEATSPTREDSIYEEDDNDDKAEEERRTDGRPSDSLSLHAESTSHAESILNRSTTGSFVQTHRRRAGSITLSHSRTASATPGPSEPPFPASLSSLAPFVQLAGTLPKHYPPPSLLKFALAKSWKSRHIVLTSPAPQPGTRTSRTDASNPAVSYLHIFRTPGPEERELERLEINESSVVFVADEEVGSRRHIVKVGGLDVGAQHKDWNIDESGLTMVLLQIVDGAESRRWIAAIKNAILGQRSLRAGLGHTSYSLNGTDGPRGDMDVELSMRRMQGVQPSPVQSSFTAPGDSSTTSSPPRTNSSSVSTHEDSIPQPPTPRSSHRPSSPWHSGGTVLSFKGLFTGARPRSLSRSSTRSDPADDDGPSTQADSFGSVGSSLLGMQGPVIVKPHSMLPVSGESPIQRRIVQNRTSVDWVPPESTPLFSIGPDTPPSPSLAPRAISPPPLQPPPRRRAWTTTDQASNPTATGSGTGRIYHHGNASAAGSFGVEVQLTPPHEDSPSATPPTSTGTNTPVGKPRAASVSSVSTLGQGNVSAALEGVAKRRWSRQSALAAPTSAASSPSQLSTRLPSHPYAAERPPSESSSSAHSTKALPGLAANFKRASMSSAASTHSAETPSPHSHRSGGLLLPVPGRKIAARMSMPPPQRPAPSSALPPTPDQRPQARPRSLSARPGTAPGAPTGSTSLVSSPGPAKPSLRDRALRLSILPPKMPPTDALPPRPDELAHQLPAHLRSVSVDAPHPPPTGPLPPTPRSADAPPASPKLATFKQRLRILSTGASTVAASAQPVQIDVVQVAAAPPGIAERIADPSFLVLAPTPTTPVEPSELPTPPLIPPRSPLRPPPPERESVGSGTTALPPPPRRRLPAPPPQGTLSAAPPVRLPEEASADMGRGLALRNTSRLSLGMGEQS
ncbi:hypothetical protein K488DRAFT_82106 [Vararia minispora EC-137]|uniref:Uncharacterized protein n=1 Tax=Vararia minispora EC-137 TaxID=1314806 RepID=A0ACB8QYQ9_9AGAM|nr:hypothetical protein K488DRAFT_82106 [Vararia minispora EC-137]